MEIIWFIGWLFSVGVYMGNECEDGEDIEVWKILLLIIVWPVCIGFWLGDK